MRQAKPILLYIPTLIIEELNHYLENTDINFSFDINRFYYLIHDTMRKHLIEDKKEFIFINKAELKKITPNIERYIKVLVDAEILLIGQKYISGKRSNDYKINPSFLNGETTTIILSTETNFFKGIVNRMRQRKAHVNNLKAHLRKMYDVFMNLDFDYEKANLWIEEQNFELKKKVVKKKKKGEKKKRKATIDKKTCYLIAVSQLKDKRFRTFKRNNTNKRLDTNITNLKKALRQFILGDYVNIDLKNSQPFLFSQLLNEVLNNNSGDTLCWFFEKHKPQGTFGKKAIDKVLNLSQENKKTLIGELMTYTDSVKDGLLYDDFVEIFGGELSRDEIKKIILVVFFSRNITESGYKPYRVEKGFFKGVYPLIYRIIFRLKYKDHSDLSIYLQKLESYIFIDCIAKELVDIGIVPLTVHDSFIVERKDQDKALEVIQRVFLENFGVIPTFEIEPLKESTEIENKQSTNLKLCA